MLSDIEHTELNIWDTNLADSMMELTEDERVIIKLLDSAGVALSINDIRKELSMTEYKVRKAISRIDEEYNLIIKQGNGSSAKYKMQEPVNTLKVLNNLLNGFEE